MEQPPKLRSAKNPGKIGGDDNGSKAHLEVRVEIGEANGGGVLDGAVGLAPALHRRHFLGGPLRPPRRFSSSFLSIWPSGWGTRRIRVFSISSSGRFCWSVKFRRRGVKINKARLLFAKLRTRKGASVVTTSLSWFTSGRFEA